MHLEITLWIVSLRHIFSVGQVWDIKNMTIPQDSATFKWSDASDHLPVIAELELQEQ
ncbi:MULTISPECIES: hypothetical protein [Proteus]|uniref:hypothetical protein n=1 Tax=Proteus TaxID=583 RepID=UPI001D12DB81